ncbi:hypothetical protein CPC08DRAFT_709181 [Agrocybe pediades]|nr:hypothetical protein CPC08DRAFT_709181 [Agrocybe pediades]
MVKRGVKYRNSSKDQTQATSICLECFDLVVLDCLTYHAALLITRGPQAWAHERRMCIIIRYHVILP